MPIDETAPPPPDPVSSQIRAARAQVEAAKQRERRLSMLSFPAGVRLPSLPRYTVKQELHRGGQGVVYLAVQESTGRRVAVKVLSRRGRSGRDDGLARFEREVETLSLLRHPNVVTIHDCGRDADHLYLVMDYIDGGPLDSYSPAGGRSVRGTLELFAKVCDGVNAAHLRGIIHRDLKPGNILVDGRGEPHVVDFGLAKPAPTAGSAGSAMTETGQFVGSLPWASPEQAEGRGDELDIRTDVYSLGVVLYQLLTGRFPYPVTGSVVEVVRNIAHTPPARPSGVPESDIDRELETILLKCLAKEPPRRYQSAGELALDLRRYLAGEPIEARRESLAYVMSKRLERYRLAVIAGTVVMVALSAALAGSVALWRRADEKAAEARAVVEFMRGVLTSVEPERAGADVRLIEVLNSAAATASARFGERPAQEAEVRDLLGQTYLKLSLWPEAKAQLGAAAAAWTRAAGPNDRRTLRTRTLHARAMLNAAQVEEAEATLRDLVPRLEKVLGPDDPGTLDARRCVALTHMFHGRQDEAERILQELRVHPRVARDDAFQIPVLGGLLAVHTQRLSTDGFDRAAVLAEAEPLALEWVERSTRRLGPDAPSTLQATVKWAEICGNLGRAADAAAACRRVLNGTAERLGECHTVRTTAMAILAEALTRLGEEREPADLFLRAIGCARQQYAADNPVLLGAISDSLRYLERGGRAAEGEVLSRELAQALRKFGGGHGDMGFMPELFTAAFVSMQGRLDEADALFAPLLAAAHGQTDPRTRARAHVMHAGHLVRRGRYEEAERELKLAADGVGDILAGTWDTHPDDIVLGFAALYEAWGRPEQAAEYRQMRERVRWP